MNTLIIDVFRETARMMLLSPEGKPIEIRFEEEEERSNGAVYLACVERISAQLHAAFVNIGTEKNAFLPLSGDEELKPGGFLLVQGVSDQENKDKGFRVRGDLQIAGHFLVYLPAAGKVQCSSKIKDQKERERLIQTVRELLRAEEGAVIRTAAEGVSGETLRAETEKMRKRMEWLSERAKTQLHPGLLWRPPMAERILNAYMSQDVGVVVTNNEDLADELRVIAEEWTPEIRIQFFREDKNLLCDHYGMDAMIRKAVQRKQWLPSGGYVIVDFCEAMTVYDVNSGGSAKGNDPEEAAFHLNKEAARLIAQHLRLANIGGIVMIDFIDMRRKENRDAILVEMRRLVKGDPAGVDAYAIGSLGVMQLSRKRTGLSLERKLRTVCRFCGGRGTEPSAAWVEADRRRALRRAALSGTQIKEQEIPVPCKEENLAEKAGY